MLVAVLLSGVADPKWPLPADCSIVSLQMHATGCAALSPFDEAALELALRMRDDEPATRVVAIVASNDTLARRVATWRPDAIHRLDLGGIAPWDAGAVAGSLAQAVRELVAEAAVVLVGREFGDFDDGSVPALAAHALGMGFIPLALNLARDPRGLSVLRQAANGLERVWPAPRPLLSVSNDPGNRLRHPLMKNVMAAKKAVIPVWCAPAPTRPTSMGLKASQPTTPPTNRAACEWLQGSPQQKASLLAQRLRAAAQA